MTGSGNERIYAMKTECKGPRASGVAQAVGSAQTMVPLVEGYVTEDRVRYYLEAICTTSAPSTVASMCRSPVLQDLWASEKVSDDPRFRFESDALGTGNAVLTIGQESRPKLWFVAHLDTISYLVRAENGGRYPLVPFCVHLTDRGERRAEVLRYSLTSGGMEVCATGWLVSENGQPFFVCEAGERPKPGDRIVPVAPFSVTESGALSGHLDNGGGVAALAVAAGAMVQLGIDAMLVFTDEEEGPTATGNQSMARGMARLASRMDPPDLAIVVDCQQATTEADGPGTVGRLGSGAVISEFSSLARGSVTPPPLHAAARMFMDGLSDFGVRVGELPNSYTSRSDDVSLMLRTQNILLLGFPASDRHFDRATPSAHLDDIVDLAKALVYASALPATLHRYAHG